MGYVYNVAIGGATHLIEPIVYGVCETAAATAAKTVAINNFVLVEGVTVKVFFEHENSAAAPTLNVGGTGAHAIRLVEENIRPWEPNEVISFTYDGTYWTMNDYGKIEVVRL